MDRRLTYISIMKYIFLQLSYIKPMLCTNIYDEYANTNHKIMYNYISGFVRYLLSFPSPFPETRRLVYVTTLHA